MAEMLLSSDYRELPPEEYCKLFRTFLELYEFEQVMAIALRHQSKDQHEAVSVSMLDVLHHDPALAYHLLHHPLPLLELFETTVRQLVESYRQLPEVRRQRQQKHRSMQALNTRGGGGGGRIHVRLHNLPPTAELTKSTIGQLRVSSDSQHLVQITGTVVRTGSIRMLKVSKEYQCMNPKCGYRFHVRADPEQGNLLPQPTVCPAPPPPEGAPSGSQGGGGGKGRGRGSGKGGVNGRGGGNGRGRGCASYSLREVDNSGEVVDYQEIKVQDQMERLQLGHPPRSLVVVLEADLVDQSSPGDDVIITGTLQKRWKPVFPGQRCQVQLALRANSVHILHSSAKVKALSADSYQHFHSFWKNYRSDDLHRPVEESDGSTVSPLPHPHEGRNRVVAAVCPQLHGMFHVKLCLLLTLIGGSKPLASTSSSSTSDTESGGEVSGDMNKADVVGGKSAGGGAGGSMHRRYQSHLLIVGDPGTGKSQLLKFASTLLPRSVMTTGVGTTGAGLTCSALRDGTDWVLEAGALVLANGGVCCIDEFASIKEQDRATIHEAMEQQTLSVAKAGLVTKLQTRCSVVAVCNPKGQYDPAVDISTNTNIASPLLSRFDLVLILLDTPQKDWDKQISTFLLNSKVQIGQGRSRAGARAGSGAGTGGGEGVEWTQSTLQAYVLLVRDRLHPQLSDAARCLLMRYYQLQRQQEASSSSFSGGGGGNAGGRVTVRALESSLRLAEAHAKLMFHRTVTFEDAVVAISCMELSSSLNSVGRGKAGQTLHAGFPSCAAKHYRETEAQVLGTLQYSRAMVASEVQSAKKTDATQEPPPSPPPSFTSSSSLGILGKRPLATPSPSTAPVVHMRQMKAEHAHAERREPPPPPSQMRTPLGDATDTTWGGVSAIATSLRKETCHSSHSSLEQPQPQPQPQPPYPPTTSQGSCAPSSSPISMYMSSEIEPSQEERSSAVPNILEALPVNFSSLASSPLDSGGSDQSITMASLVSARVASSGRDTADIVATPGRTLPAATIKSAVTTTATTATPSIWSQVESGAGGTATGGNDMNLDALLEEDEDFL